LKKFVSILLLGILFFNLCGYQMLHVYLEKRAVQQLQLKLEFNNYDEKDLVSIKVPAIHLPYYRHSMQFEIFNGQLEAGGISYCYVKRRFSNDSIEMLCIPNLRKMELQHCKFDFIDLVNDLKPLEKNQKANSTSKKNNTTEYLNIQTLIKSGKPNYIFQNLGGHYPVFLPGQSLAEDEHPPERGV